MQHHKNLYKESMLVLSPRNHNELNRQHQRQARLKQRNDCFQTNRNISISPTPSTETQNDAAANCKTEQAAAPTIDALLETLPVPSNSAEKGSVDKENNATTASSSNSSISAKTSHQNNFLQRFLNWKNAEKEKQRLQKLKQRQAAPGALAANSGTAFPHKSLTFKPPVGLKDPATSTEEPLDKKRRSIYVVVESKKKTQGSAAHNDTQMQRSAKCRTLNKVTTSNGTNKPLQLAATVSDKPTGKSTTVARRPLSSASKPVSAAAKTTAPTTTLKVTENTKPGAPTSVRTTVKPATASSKTLPERKPVPPTITTLKKPSPQKMLKPNQKPPANLVTQPFNKPVVAKPNIVKPIRGGGAMGGAVAKFKQANDAKRSTALATKTKGANLSTRMKAQKPTPRAANHKFLLQEIKKGVNLKDTQDASHPPDTPLDAHSYENPFHTRATSTQCKNSNTSDQLFDPYGDTANISPIDANRRSVGAKLSAKRRLLAGSELEQNKKFNFVRYSGVDPLVESPTIDEVKATSDRTVVSAESKNAEEDKTLQQPKTPPRAADSEPNYLSPFVSVSRGKVNSRFEREKRNSMYLQDQEQQQPDTPVAVRRILETVRYFRLQLDNEIKRLHAICDEWEAYSADHVVRLQETGGVDMIHAAVGQTKLLTSRKLTQFSGLIDRCEAGAKGVEQKANDGSEDTKLVQAADLEGWWDMLRLQSENIDKRFQNLERWKLNNWLDPDAEQLETLKTKKKTKLAKVLKPKATAKPSSNLKQFLLKAYAECRRQPTEEVIIAAVDPETIPEGSTARRHSKRLSNTQHHVVVLDRRCYSPTPTVVRKSINGRRNSGAARQSIEGRPSIGAARSSIGSGGANIMLKSAIMGALEQKRLSLTTTPPPAEKARPRGSILKTPGTVKREPRCIVFSAKKKVRKFQFTFDEGCCECSDDEAAVGSDKLEDLEEDMSLESSHSRRSLEQSRCQSAEGDATVVANSPGNISRTYSLRNRKVKLRPSSDFM